MSKDFTVSRLCDIYGALLTDRRRDLIRNYYDYDLSLAEIAENCGITRQAALYGIKQAEKQLREYESALGILANAARVQSGLVELFAALDCGTETAKQKLQALINELYNGNNVD